MPTPNLYVISDENPFAEVSPELQSNEVDVLFVTDRVPEEKKDGSIEYGYGRSPSLAFGSSVIEIGRDVPWDVLVRECRARKRTTSLPLSISSITELGRFPETPPIVTEVEGSFVPEPAYEAALAQSTAALQAEIERRLAKTPRKSAFVFVHGFHVPFESAVLTVGEAWHFGARRGVAIAYTWPAGHPGMIRGYNRDRESGEFTIYHLKQFLRALASCPDLAEIQLVAHSRGTDVAGSAVRELVIEAIAAGRDPQEATKIRNLVLLAPDLDLEVADQRFSAERAFRAVGRVTIYVSKHDEAIGLSGWLFASRRRMGDVHYEDLSEEQKTRLTRMRKLQVVDVRDKTGQLLLERLRELRPDPPTSRRPRCGREKRPPAHQEGQQLVGALSRVPGCRGQMIPRKRPAAGKEHKRRIPSSGSTQLRGASACTGDRPYH